ncbi:MAG: hypothetical protein JJU11_14945 [Candidatus Sumerlaeia bacterium]|nr:hypothetical protein [Candidatus Sumerlaeia bacterium]
MTKSTKGLPVLAALLLAGTLSAQGTTWVVDAGGTGDFTTLAAALSNAALEDGDSIRILEGRTNEPSSGININHSVRIYGEGQEVSTISRNTGIGTSTNFLQVRAPNVTIESLTIDYGNGLANVGRGYIIETNQPNTTIENVELFGNMARSAVVLLNGADSFRMEYSRVTGDYFRGAIRGAATNFLIRENVFEENHYMWGPIYFEYHHEINGIITHNYFGNRVGMYNNGSPVEGGFRTDGSEILTIVVFNTNVGDGMIEIAHNTFVSADAGLQNTSGNYAQVRGIQVDSSVTSRPAGSVVIRDNIFTGFKSDDPVLDPDLESDPGYEWVPGGGVFGGALSLQGIGAHGTFQDASFDIGSVGTFNMWVNMRDMSRRNHIFEGPGDTGIQLSYRENSGGQFYARPFTPTGNDYSIMSGGAAALQDQWANIQATWDVDQNSEFRLYINGTEVDYLSGFGPSIPAWTTENVTDTVNGLMSFGIDPGVPDRALDALVDDVAFYNTVLDQSTLANIRTNGVAPHGNLLAHWDFNQESGDVVAPASGTTIPMNIVPAPTGSEGYVPGAIFRPVTNSVAVFTNLFFDNYLHSTVQSDLNDALVDVDPALVGEGSDTRARFALELGPDPAASPALSAASDGTAIGAFQPSTIWVAEAPEGDDSNPGTNPLQPLASIERGVRALDYSGGQVNVGFGTFPTATTVNQPITITGSGVHGTFLTPATSPNTGLTAMADLNVRSLQLRDHDVAIAAEGSAQVSVELAALSNSADAHLLLASNDASITVSHNLIYGDNVVSVNEPGGFDPGSVQVQSNWYSSEHSIAHNGGYIPGLAKEVGLPGEGLNIVDTMIVAQLDRDADGIYDVFELSPHFDTAFNAFDTAGNGRPDGTDGIEPFVINLDSDGDGYVDWYELNAGTNPANQGNYPVLGDVLGTGSVELADAVRALQIINGTGFPGDLNALNVTGNVNTPLTLPNPLQILRFQAAVRTALPAKPGVD